MILKTRPTHRFTETTMQTALSFLMYMEAYEIRLQAIQQQGW